MLVWQPPTRLVLAWQIDATWQFNPDFLTEVEIRFTPEGNGTQVELEHRGLERYGEQQGTMRGLFESPNGWGGLLEAFTRQTIERRDAIPSARGEETTSRTRLYRESSGLPFWISVFQPADGISALAQQGHRLECQHAVRAAAIGDDFAAFRQ